MRTPLIVLGSLIAATTAAAQTCDPAYPGACVHPTASVDASATVLAGASVESYATVGPSVELDAGIIASRATLTGRISGPLNQPFGFGSVLGRNSAVGGDADIDDDVTIGRNVTIGTDLIAGSLSSVGYGTRFGDRLTLGNGAAVGTLVTGGDDATIDGVVARGVQLGDRVTITGIIGPNVTVGNDSTVAGRVRKDAVIGNDVDLDAGARIGRGAIIGNGVVMGPNVTIGTNAVVPDCAWLPGPETVGNGQTWAGTLFVPGCTPPAPDVIQFTSPSQAVPWAVAYDSAGNRYVVGHGVSDQSVDGSLVQSASSSTPTSFVAKFDPAGNLVWYVPASSTGVDIELRAMAIHGTDLYIGGHYVGLGTLGSATLPFASRSQIVVAKLSTADGSIHWTQNAVSSGSFGQSRVNDLHADASGATLVGTYAGTVAFGATPALPSISTTPSSTLDFDATVAHITPSGAWDWTLGGGYTQSDSALSVAGLANGNLAVSFVAGGTSKGFANSFIPPEPFTLTSGGGLVIISPSGTVLHSHHHRNATVGGSVGWLTTIGNRVFASSTISADGLDFAGIPFAPLSPGARDVAVLEYSATATPVQSWVGAGTLGTASVHELASSGTDVFLLFGYRGAVQFGSSFVALPDPATGFGWEGIGLAGLDVNGGGWQWSKGSVMQLPASGQYWYNGIGLASYGTGPSTELTFTASHLNIPSYDFDGATISVPGNYGGSAVTTSATSSWGL